MFILRILLLPSVLVIHSQHLHAHALQFKDPSNAPYFNYLPCPNAEDIAPCTCAYLEDEGYMDMDCTNIADEQELYNVFHAPIPFPEFMNLNLETNNLKNLSDAIFGEATFERVVTSYDLRDNSGTLSYVGPKTFIKSNNTLRILYLEGNDLTENSFPFDTLSQYTELTDLSFHGNPIKVFPTIESATLKALWMCHDTYPTISAGALDHLPNLEKFTAYFNNIDSMETGLFSSLQNMKIIDMKEAGLGNLEALQFEINSSSIELIDLQTNQIASVEYNTFKGVENGTIDLRDNQLTHLPEITWGPLIEAGVQLMLADNDLLCGCDVAWLVLESSFHELVEDATCHDGQLLVNLDPTFFEIFC